MPEWLIGVKILELLMLAGVAVSVILITIDGWRKLCRQ